MPERTTRTARLEARIARNQLALIRRAAQIQGRSLSDFVVAAASDAARRTIEDADIIRLSVAGQRAFAEALLTPPKPSAGLKKAFSLHRKLIREVR